MDTWKALKSMFYNRKTKQRLISIFLKKKIYDFVERLVSLREDWTIPVAGFVKVFF